MMDAPFEHYRDLFEQVARDARRRYVSQEALDCTTAEGLKQARETVNNVIGLEHLTANELSKRSGIKPTAVHEFRHGKWRGKAGTELACAQTLIKTIDQFFAEREADETRIVGFVTTRAAEAIVSLTKLCCKRRMIGVFLMPAGHGKTMCLDYLRDDIAGAVLVTVTNQRGSVKSFLQIWARALGLPEAGRAEDLQDAIVGFLKSRPRLMLIDEAHKLQVRALDVIREVWDACRCPMVMAATPSFHATLTTQRVGEHTREIMDQLYRRIGIFRDLTTMYNPDTREPEDLVTIDDLRKVFGRAKVRFAKDGLEWLIGQANLKGGGGLGTCVALVQTCIDLFPGEIITHELLREAMEGRVGLNEAGYVEELIVQHEGRRSKTA